MNEGFWRGLKGGGRQEGTAGLEVAGGNEDCRRLESVRELRGL